MSHQNDDDENEETNSDTSSEDSDDSDDSSGGDGDDDGDGKADHVDKSGLRRAGAADAGTAAGPRPSMVAAAVYRYTEIGNPSVAQFFEGMLSPAGAGAAPSASAPISGGASSHAPAPTSVQLQHVMQLSLLGVSPNRQGRGTGSRLVEQLVAKARMDGASAVVVYADHASAGFFRHLGFTDDPVLNGRYRSMPDILTRSVLMSYSLLSPPPRIMLSATGGESNPHLARSRFVNR
jgi:GNAT superfamily N-acetyltransferase